MCLHVLDDPLSQVLTKMGVTVHEGVWKGSYQVGVV